MTAGGDDHVRHHDTTITTKSQSAVTTSTLPAMDEQDERQPLLSSGTRATQKGKKRLSYKAILYLLYALIVLVSFGDMIELSPRTRILESIICYKYYEANDPSKILLSRAEVGPGAIGGVDEMDCKIDAVSGELAVIDGYMNTFSMVPGLILAVPYGWVADKYGRWPVLFANLVQMLLGSGWVQIVTWFWQSFDIEWVWFSAAFNVIGGGQAVIASLFFVMLADIMPEAERTAAFLRVAAFNVSAMLLMPPLSAALMEYNPWLPNLIGALLFVMGILAFLAVPETKGYQQTIDGQSAASDEVTNASPDEAAGLLDMPAGAVNGGQSQALSIWAQSVASVQDLFSALLHDWRVVVLIIPFAGHLLVAGVNTLLLQYLSKRYALTMSKGTILMTVRNATLTLLLFTIIPWVSTYITRAYNLSSQRKDYLLAFSSEVISAIGWTLVGLAPNWQTSAISLIIASSGHGAASMLRSLLATIIPPDKFASVFTLVSVLDTVGAIGGFPIAASLFKRGLSLGGVWIGLPFFFIAFYSAVFAALIYVVPVDKAARQDMGEDIDEDR